MDTMAVRPRATGVAEARHAIAADLHSRDVAGDVVDDVVLVTGELVGNAFEHTDDAEQVDVTWAVEDDAVTVHVADGSHVAPQPRQAGHDEPGGRGLAIVAALTDGWGSRRTDTGKQVWARIPR
jgi:two-component sensor histidine kinase